MCDHVTKFWPMECECWWYIQFLGYALKRKLLTLHFHPSPHFLSLVGWIEYIVVMSQPLPSDKSNVPERSNKKYKDPGSMDNPVK